MSATFLRCWAGAWDHAAHATAQCTLVRALQGAAYLQSTVRPECMQRHICQLHCAICLSGVRPPLHQGCTCRQRVALQLCSTRCMRASCQITPDPSLFADAARVSELCEYIASSALQEAGFPNINLICEKVSFEVSCMGWSRNSRPCSTLQRLFGREACSLLHSGKTWILPSGFRTLLRIVWHLCLGGSDLKIHLIPGSPAERKVH